MQLGARWNAGDPPHRSVPPTLHDAISALEGAHPQAESWTLTWLEGLPRCELDDLARVTLSHSGEVLSQAIGSVDSEDDEDDWLR